MKNLVSENSFFKRSTNIVEIGSCFRWKSDSANRYSCMVILTLNFWKLSGSPANSGAVPLTAAHSTLGPKIIFPHFLSVKRVWHIYTKKATYYFPVSYFCLATSQDWILDELRSPSVIRKVKFTYFVRRATSPKMHLAEFRFFSCNFEGTFITLTVEI